jgi:hypothetical protein
MISSIVLVILAVFAHAECGWVLMAPPGGIGTPYREVSLTQWDQVGAYDSANDCERARRESVHSIGRP